jgi:hypothetical protein
LTSEQKLTLFDISIWNEEGSWKEWSLGDSPNHMHNQSQVFNSLLKGASPILIDIPDNRGWGKYGYAVKQGYKIVISSSSMLQSLKKSKKTWIQDALPKINIFIWTLSHGKIITRENLMKRGFHDPFNCPLCQSNNDTIQHLLWDCSFSTIVWNATYGELNHQNKVALIFKPCLGNCEKYYQGTFCGKLIFKRLWRSLPNIICWKIWLAINK